MKTRNSWNGLVLGALLVVLPLATVAGCQTRKFNTTSSRVNDSAASVSRSQFYSLSQMHYVHITNWPNDKIYSWQIGKDTTVPGAKLTIYRLGPQHTEHCPTPASFSADQKIFETSDFSISPRGDKTSGTAKGSFLIKMSKSDERFLGMKRLHMVAMWNDLSQMREALSSSLMQSAKVPVPRNSFVKFCFDNRYNGLYTNIEDVDEKFAAEMMNVPKFSMMYEGGDGPNDLNGDLVAREGVSPRQKYLDKGYKIIAGDPNASLDDLEKFIRVANGSDAPVATRDAYFASDAFRTDLEKVFEVETFLRWMAMNQLIVGWDNYYWNPKNYFLMNTGTEAAPLFRWITIDLDNTFGQSFHTNDWSQANILDWEGTRPPNLRLPLVTNVLKNPIYRSKYLSYLNEWTGGNAESASAPFTITTLGTSIDSIWKLIERAVKQESDSEYIDMGKADPFKMAHTARQFTTNDIREQVTDSNLQNADIHGWANMTAPALKRFIIKRQQSVRSQLKQLP